MIERRAARLSSARMSRRLSPLPLLGLALLVVRTAAGQGLAPAPAAPAPGADDADLEAPESPKAGVSADVTVVATRLGIPTAGSTVRVLTRRDVEKSVARSLPELLRALPGVDVRRRGVEGIQADIGLRGGDYNGTLILVDGEPVNDPQTNHLSTDLDVPLDAIERVEVLYGAGAALYGSNAIGGVVNVVTRGAALGKARAAFEGRYVHGTHSLDAGSFRAATRLGDSVSVAVDGSRAESAGFRDDADFSSNALRVSSRLDTARGPLTLALGYGGRRYGAYAFYGTRFPNQQETTRTRTARLSSELTFGSWTLSPSIALRAHHDDFVLERSNPAFYENLHDSDLSTARLFARTPLLGGSLVLGAEAGRESIESTNLGVRRRDRVAGFLEVGRPFDVDAPGRGGLTAGLRADAYDGFGSRLSPHAAVSVSPLAGLALRASVGTAFRIPTFTDLYYSDPQNRGNPNLRPERSTSWEAGATVDLGAVSLDAAYFFRRATDLVDYVRSAPTERYEARNVRKADISGVEATAELRLPALRGEGVALTRLALHAAYVFVDLAKLSAAADGATEGKYVLDPLHTKWDLLLGARLPFGVEASSRLTYFSRPTFADGVFLVEARLARPLLEGDVLELYVEGENLGNRRYEERPGVPLPRRTFAAGLRLTW